MKKIVLAIMVLGLLMTALPVQAQSADQKIKVDGELRTRWENLNNYTDFDDDSTDRIDFWPYRARLNVAAMLAKNVSVMLSVQNVGSFGNQTPDRSGATFGNPIFQNFSGGGLPSGFNSSETTIYQANVFLNDLGGSKLDVGVGRMEYSFGTGLILGNEEFYNGTTFDGVKGSYDFEKWNLTGFMFNTNEGNDPGSIWTFEGTGTQDHRLLGGVATFNVGDKMKSEINGYVINFHDFFADQTFGNMDMYTFGARWGRMVKTKADAEDSGWSWNGEIAMQTGEATDAFAPPSSADFDTEGMIVDASVGYTFVAGDNLHKVWGGFISQSGDDDLTDDEVGGWMPLHPRSHGRYGYADFFGAAFSVSDNGSFGSGSGITAAYLGYNWTSKEGRHKLGASFWNFAPTEDSIDTGAGTNDIEDFGQEFDGWYKYMYSDNVNFEVVLSDLMVDNGLTGTGSGVTDDDVVRIYGQMRVLFP